MARNIEIKARIADLEEIRRNVAQLADQGPFEIPQDDTFFECERGRLKLRFIPPNQGQLIFYRRPAVAGPKESFYVLSQTSSPDSLREVLTLAYGQSGRVRKHRTLYLIGRTRVHLDSVEGLGDFLELEVVLAENEEQAPGLAEAQKIMASLQIDSSQLIDVAYVDLATSSAKTV